MEDFRFPISNCLSAILPVKLPPFFAHRQNYLRFPLIRPQVFTSTVPSASRKSSLLTSSGAVPFPTHRPLTRDQEKPGEEDILTRARTFQAASNQDANALFGGKKRKDGLQPSKRPVRRSYTNISTPKFLTITPILNTCSKPPPNARHHLPLFVLVPRISQGKEKHSGPQTAVKDRGCPERRITKESSTESKQSIPM